MSKSSKSPTTSKSPKTTSPKTKPPKTKPPKLSWAAAPAEHDYPSAGSYLRLVAAPAQVEVLTALLTQAPTVQQHAKDILRAARLPLLPATDPEVAKDLDRAARGIALSPILLVRGDLAAAVPLQIADGYHRVCASYHLGEDTDIPCRMVELPALVS
jgi:hypothetical protein